MYTVGYTYGTSGEITRQPGGEQYSTDDDDYDYEDGIMTTDGRWQKARKREREEALALARARGMERASAGRR